MARRPMRPIVAAGRPPLLAVVRTALLVLVLVLLLGLMRLAHAGWGGVDDRKDPRLVIKKPGATRQVAPGQPFNVAVNIKKAQRRVPALFEVVLPDGALFVGPAGHRPKQTNNKGLKGRTPAPTSGSGWKAKRAAAKHFPLPHAVINGTAGERTLQWHLNTFEPRHNPIKLKFEVDFCGPPSPLVIRLNWQQGGRSARPAVITVSCLVCVCVCGGGGSGRLRHPELPEKELEWDGMTGNRAHTGHTHPYKLPHTAQRIALGQRPRGARDRRRLERAGAALRIPPAHRLPPPRPGESGRVPRVH